MFQNQKENADFGLTLLEFSLGLVEDMQSGLCRWEELFKCASKERARPLNEFTKRFKPLMHELEMSILLIGWLPLTQGWVA